MLQGTSKDHAASNLWEGNSLNRLTPNLFDETAEALLVLSEEGLVTFANAAFGALYGSHSDALIGLPYRHFFAPGEIEAVELQIGFRGTDRDPSVSVHLNIFPERLVRLSAQPIFDSDRRWRGACLILRDQSDRASYETSSHLTAIVESSVDAIISKRLDGTIVSWNRGAEQIFGYSAAEIVGQSIRKLIPPDLLHEEDTILAQLQAGNRVLPFETIRLDKNGRPIDVSVTSSPIRDFAGDVVGASTIARDLSADRHSEQLSSHLAAIVESSDDAIIGKSLEGIVTSWNQGASRIFGYSAQEMIGQSILRIVPPERTHEEAIILAHLVRGERIDHFETVRVAADGRLIDVSVTVSPIRNARGEIVGASKISRVITDRKLAEMALKESAESLRGLNAVLEKRVQERTSELAAALAEMEGFTYTISHDLRSPLRSIIAQCRLMEEDFGTGLPEPAKHHLTRQIAAANRMASLIDDLLRLSRIGRQELVRQNVNISQLAIEISGEVISSQGSEDVEISVQPGITAEADPVLARLAVLNLIENACKFRRPGVCPRIEVGSAEGIVYVTDNGIGFDPRYSEKIFLPFERLHRDEEYPGTGIGLANVRRIVERHGGAAWADGRPGEGATFYLRFGPEKRPNAYEF